MRRAGMWLTWSGGVLILVCVIAIVASMGQAFDATTGGDDDPIAIPGPGESAVIYFEADEHLQLWTTSTRGLASGPEPECSVDGPAEVEPGTQLRSTITVMNTTRESFASFIVVESGVYTITCDQAGVTIAPPVSFEGFLSVALAMFLGVAGAMLASVLVVLGIILWVFGSRPKQLPPPLASQRFTSL